MTSELKFRRGLKIALNGQIRSSRRIVSDDGNGLFAMLCSF